MEYYAERRLKRLGLLDDQGKSTWDGEYLWLLVSSLVSSRLVTYDVCKPVCKPVSGKQRAGRPATRPVVGSCGGPSARAERCRHDHSVSP